MAGALGRMAAPVVARLLEALLAMKLTAQPVLYYSHSRIRVVKFIARKV